MLRNVERIVREEMDRAGAQEVLMPAVQPAAGAARCASYYSHTMGNLKKKRRLKMNKHKRRKRLKANRHKKRTWQK